MHIWTFGEMGVPSSGINTTLSPLDFPSSIENIFIEQHLRRSTNTCTLLLHASQLWITYLSPFNMPTATTQKKRSKSANVSIVQRFLICCCALIWVRTDQRERDPETDELIPKEVNKRGSPSSDLSQSDIVRTYFNNIDRTVISQSKWSHKFARPDFSHINAYLFPFIRFNPNISRGQILHSAYRIWEYLVLANRTGPVRFQGAKAVQNIQLGAPRGWWEEATTVRPRGYDTWYARWTQNSKLPGTTTLLPC